MPKFGFIHSEESRKKMRSAHRGTNHQSLEVREKIRQKKLSRRITKICPNCNKEFRVKPSHRRRLYCSKQCQYSGQGFKEKMSKSKIGNKNPQWLDGRSYQPYSTDWTKTLKRAIRERDNYICQICNQYGNEVHHIDYNKKNCNPGNLITLCRSCHRKTNFDRDYWENYFLCKI